jgi:hypothetical protein
MSASRSISWRGGLVLATVAAAAGLALVLSAGPALTSSQLPPDVPPPGFTADGRFDPALLPDRIGVVGADGRPLRDRFGVAITRDPEVRAPTGRPRAPRLRAGESRSVVDGVEIITSSDD